MSALTWGHVIWDSEQACCSPSGSERCRPFFHSASPGTPRQRTRDVLNQRVARFTRESTVHFFSARPKVPFGLPHLFFWRRRQDFFSSTRASGHPGSSAPSWRSTSPALFERKPERAPGDTQAQDPFRQNGDGKQRAEGRVGGSAHHHGKNNGSGRRLDHPEQHQARELGDGEQVNLSQRDVPQVDEVWLVLCRHAEQLEAVKELRKRASGRDDGDRTEEKQMDRELKI